MKLAELQRALLASLTGAAPSPAPDGCDARQIARARRALIQKRARAAEHLLPTLRAALGDEWFRRFTAHACHYTAAGMLYHVDDAWMFALVQRRKEESRRVAEAARTDLTRLAQWYTRDVTLDALRVRERPRLRDTVRRWLRAWLAALRARAPTARRRGFRWIRTLARKVTATLTRRS